VSGHSVLHNSIGIIETLIFVVIHLLINCNDYNSVAGEWVFYFLVVRNISGISFADACSSNITSFPLLKPILCQGFVFWIGEGYR
jgi:hypothetical protein